jgi:hypothetical protein
MFIDLFERLMCKFETRSASIMLLTGQYLVAYRATRRAKLACRNMPAARFVKKKTIVSGSGQTTPAFEQNLSSFSELQEVKMITNNFDQRTIANMEVALDRACQRFPEQLSKHEARKRVAARIVERAACGERTLKGFTDAAKTAAVVLTSRKSRVQHRA